jgi:hypothetical protein
MRELERAISWARRRMRLQTFVSALVWSLTFALAIAALVIGGERLGWYRLPRDAWWIPLGAFIIGVVAAALIAMSRGPSVLDAALAIDRRFALGERLSTAIALPEDLRETPAGEALLGDTQKQLSGLDIGARFALSRPRAAWAPLVPALLVSALLFLPANFLSGVSKAASKLSPKEEAQARKAIAKALKSVSQTLAEKRKQLQKPELAETGKVIAQIEKTLDDLSKSPPADKQQALIEMNKLADAVQERRKQVGTAEQVKRQLDQMKELTSGGPADDLAKDLARGEFTKSMQDLKKLQEKLASGKMNEAEKQELARQLAEIKKQLEKVANLEERRKQLEEAKKSGMISEQQYQEQKQKLDQQSKQMQALQQLAQKLGEAQQQMIAGEMKQAAQALKEAESQIAELADQMQQIESLDEALAELQDAKNALADQGMNQLGEQLLGMNGLGMDGNRPGSGQGLGRGRGQGDRPEAPDRTANYDSKVRQQITKGKAIPGGFSDRSKIVRGESLLIEQGNVEAVVGAETEALSDQKIPNSVRKHIQAYFDQVRQGGE